MCLWQRDIASLEAAALLASALAGVVAPSRFGGELALAVVRVRREREFDRGGVSGSRRKVLD